MTRSVLDDLPPEVVAELRAAAFLQGYLAARLWLMLWRWRYDL